MGIDTHGVSNFAHTLVCCDTAVTKHWDSDAKKVEDRLSTWKANSLSIVGRLTLIKSVLGSLPLYFLYVFHAPIAVVKKIESLRVQFFWRSTGEWRKITGPALKIYLQILKKVA